MEQSNKIVTDINYLHRPCEWVKETDHIEQTMFTLLRKMVEHHVWGLAANQIRVPLRIFVMRVEPNTPICVVNGIIVKSKGADVGNEMCLSLPGITMMLRRPREVVLTGVNQYFRPVKYRLKGLRARIACHEMDHLCGKLIIDYEV